MDVTDRKKAEEAIATVSGRLIEAHEEERRRIARELHDDINQRLALLAVELQRLGAVLPDSPARLRDQAEQLFERASEISIDVQALSHQLHSSKLELMGIAAAAKSLCAERAEQQGVQIAFTCSDVPSPVPGDISLCLFRVLQEALHNAIRHSGMSYFEVQLRGVSGGIELAVCDSGAGFDPQDAMNNRGLGLISMRERVSLVKGTISIASTPKGGTEIRVRVPVAIGVDTNQLSASA